MAHEYMTLVSSEDGARGVMGDADVILLTLAETWRESGRAGAGLWVPVLPLGSWEGSPEPTLSGSKDNFCRVGWWRHARGPPAITTTTTGRLARVGGGRRGCQPLAMPVMSALPAPEVKGTDANHSPSVLRSWNKTTWGSRAMLPAK